jgi:carboxypeptidase T
MGRLLAFSQIVFLLSLQNLTHVYAADAGVRGSADPNQRHWVRLKAATPAERTKLSNAGVAIEVIKPDFIAGSVTEAELAPLRNAGLVLDETPIAAVSSQAFPVEDAIYHDYAELTDALKELAAANPDLVKLDSLGKSAEQRELWHVTLSGHVADSNRLPAVAFYGGHHAREHLSMEIPLLLAQDLIAKYRAGEPRIVNLLNSRQVHIIPCVNPDGAEYDISGDQYHYWRKNRGTVGGRKPGIDLNRNYDQNWGGEGSSDNQNSEVYHGPSPFSEPESQAMKRFIEGQSNLTLALSFHTFSQLILYPWGGTEDRINDQRDYDVHRRMAEKMAQWNGYEPMQSSELYVAGGDSADWIYAARKIVSFTFELDPGQMAGSGGFYPGPAAVASVFNKNWEPCLYLIEYADNPYRVL